MRTTITALVVALCALYVCAVPGAEAAALCGGATDVTPVATKTASAGYLANFTNRDGSIRATSKSMLDSAINSAESSDGGKRIVFKSIPELSTKSDAGDPMCDRYEKATTKDPLEFNGKRFASVDDLTDWIMDFTQGKGADGESLYKQCPGNCSPQYTWWIDPVESGLNVDARVICGPPRDHDSDKYTLSTAFVTGCGGVKSN